MKLSSGFRAIAADLLHVVQQNSFNEGQNAGLLHFVQSKFEKTFLSAMIR